MTVRLVVPALLLSAATAGAQVTSTVDLLARSEQSSADAGQRIGIAPTLQLRGARAVVSVRGFLNADTETGDLPFAAISASAFIPRGERLSLALLAAGARLDAPTPAFSSTTEFEARLQWQGRTSGIWLGAGGRWDDASGAAPLYGSGVWARWGSATLTGSVRRAQFASAPLVTGPLRIDTLDGRPRLQPPDNTETRSELAPGTELRLGVELVRGPLALALDGGARLGGAGNRREWGTVSAALSLSPQLAVVASWGDEPFTSELRRAPGRHISLGVRLSPRVLMGRPSPRTTPARVASFVVEADGKGRHTFRALVPGAHTVEIAGDFSGWVPIPLTRTADSAWETTLPLSPGLHHLRMRIDGGAWMVPPGMMTVGDGYGGTAAVLLIP